MRGVAALLVRLGGVGNKHFQNEKTSLFYGVLDEVFIGCCCHGNALS